MNLDQYHGIIDLGYLSYKIISGSRYLILRDFLKGWILIGEGRENLRNKLYPDYKLRRRERRLDPEKLATHQQVLEIRNTISQDPLLTTISLDGLEADDLVAALVILDPRETPVVAIDKDLQFLSRLKDRGGARFYLDPVPPLNRVSDRVPYKSQYFAEYDYGSAFYFLLTQAMIGDKSDSIPRLLPSSGAESARVWKGLFGRKYNGEPLDFERICAKVYQHFGDAFIQNLKLVTMPYVAARDNRLKSPEVFMHSLIYETYWEPKYWTELSARIDEAFELNVQQAEEDLNWSLPSRPRPADNIGIFVEPSKKERTVLEMLDAFGLDG